MIFFQNDDCSGSDVDQVPHGNQVANGNPVDHGNPINDGNQVDSGNQVDNGNHVEDGEVEDSSDDADERVDENITNKEEESRIHGQIKDLLKKIQEKENDLDELNKVI